MSIGVVVAHDDERLVEEIAEALESAPDLFVAATAAEAARSGNVLVAGGQILATLRRSDVPLVALALDEPLRAARAALALGAADLVSWPHEVERLAGAIRRAASGKRSAASGGRVVAVAGARGGLGVSTLCALIAAAVPEALVVDLDPGSGQRTFASEEPPRTLHDLAPFLADARAEDLQPAIATHAGGRCLHAEPYAEPLSPAGVHGLMRAARELAPVTIADCGRAQSPGARAAIATADACVLVAGNDVASVRGTRAMALREPVLVVRRIRRGGVAIRDLAAAIGREPAAVLCTDSALARAADLGRLPSRPTTASRAVRRLLRALDRQAR